MQRKLASGLLFLVGSVFAQSPVQQNAAKSDFFESKVRPVLAKNCQMCHNPKMKSAGLDVSTAAGFVAGGQSGPLVNAKEPEKSRLLHVISYDEALKMPPMGKLKPEDLANLETWVKLGAPWPGADPAAIAKLPPPAPGATFTSEQKTFWAFQPVKKVTPPDLAQAKIESKAWVQNAIDGFVISKLQAQGLKPAPRTDNLSLLRRATFDLTGLPPTLAEIQAYLADTSPQAYEKVIDRLLASSRYGERWGRHWLDVARFADSTGNDEDHRYPYAWRYRDYVIDSFNKDVPYDQFIREQLAGDLLAAHAEGETKKRDIVATGFLALGAKALAQQDKQKMMYDIYDEQVDVTSRAFLGMTMACARCHNHKFDPILTKDYYSMVAMFASTQQFDDPKSHVSKLLYTPLVPKEQYEEYKAQQDKLSLLKVAVDEVASVDGEKYTRTQSTHLAQSMLAAREIYEGGQPATAELKRWVTYLSEGGKAHPQLADWDNAPKAQRTQVAQAYQTRFLGQFDAWTKRMDIWRTQVRARALAKDMPPPEKPKFEAATDLFFYEVYIQQGPLHLADKARDKVLSPEVLAKVTALNKEFAELKAHAKPEPDMACAVAEGESVAQKVFIRGDYNSPGEDAPKAFPTILATPADPAIRSASGRMELANWIASPQNPMTAKVMVNRLWQWHFGEGIVRTPDNFGKMGDRPSHPELLDFLATRFTETGWSIKAMHKLMMLSSTYQTSSDADPKTMEADGENRLLAHFNRQRLDVEEIRDSMLAIGGTLDLTMGGTLQKGFGTDGENSADRLSMDPTKLTRRTVYIPLRRANLPNLMNLFDFGDATTVNGKRTGTNVAPQTLFMMNSEFAFDHAKRVAEAVLALPNAANAQRLQQAYLRILNRNPEPQETDSALTYLANYAAKYPGANPQLSAWQSFCHILLSSNEFVYLD